MTAETLIMEALFGHLATLVLAPAHPIAWPNVPFAPPSNQRYLRAIFVPNAADRFGYSTSHQIYGFLQVNAHGTKGAGEASVRSVAAAVAAHFPCDLTLSSGATSVRITQRPELRDLIVEDASVFVPVLIPWETFA